MNKLLVLLVCGAVGSAAAQVPVITNARASGAPAISGDLIAFPAAQVVNNTVVHTLKYYAISSGVTVDTGKQVATFDFSGPPVSPSISGVTIAYIAPPQVPTEDGSGTSTSPPRRTSIPDRRFFFPVQQDGRPGWPTSRAT